MFFKIVVLTVLKSLFNKVAGLRPATLSKRDSNTVCFPVKFAKSLGTPFFTQHLRLTLHDGGPYHKETSTLICSANQ